MNRTFKFLALTSVFFCALALTAQSKIIYDIDSGKDVHLKVGERIELHLNSNPSTGFSWYVHKESTPLMKLVSQTFNGPEDPMPGAGGIQIFVFEGKRSGDGILLLHYVRSWEKPSPDETQFKLHVIIE
jgi:inhibitor of cysteine peptidase